MEGSPLKKLTEREFQVLCKISEGKLNKEISAHLEISIDTVKKHIKNIFRKINTRNRVEAANFALIYKYQPEDDISTKYTNSIE